MANNTQKVAGAGLGLAALAAAAAGAYYFYGAKKAPQHRKKLRSWAVKATGEVMERVEKMRDVTEDAYNKAVSEVMNKYRKVKSIDPSELAQAAKEMKNQWNRIAGQLKTTPSKSRTKTTKRKKT
jgi:hypothetical protein